MARGERRVRALEKEEAGIADSPAIEPVSHGSELLLDSSRLARPEQFQYRSHGSCFRRSDQLAVSASH